MMARLTLIGLLSFQCTACTGASDAGDRDGGVADSGLTEPGEDGGTDAGEPDPCADVVIGTSCAEGDAGPASGAECTYVKEGACTLQWLACSAGQSGADCSVGEAVHLNQTEAIAFCDALNWAGFSDWRLPNIDEVRVLVSGCLLSQSEGACGVAHVCSRSTGPNGCDESNCGGCAANQGPGIGGCYWPADLGGDCGGNVSSTLRAGNEAYGLNFLNGEVYGMPLDDFFMPSFRCVR